MTYDSLEIFQLKTGKTGKFANIYLIVSVISGLSV